MKEKAQKLGAIYISILLKRTNRKNSIKFLKMLNYTILGLFNHFFINVQKVGISNGFESQRKQKYFCHPLPINIQCARKWSSGGNWVRGVQTWVGVHHDWLPLKGSGIKYF